MTDKNNLKYELNNNLDKIYFITEEKRESNNVIDYGFDAINLQGNNIFWT